MEQAQLLVDDAHFFGATVHFERHLYRWKIWNYFQYFFLIIAVGLVICYIAKNNYRITSWVPIIVASECIIETLVYAYWRYQLKKKENFLDCANYLKQQQIINYEWVRVSDMHYCKQQPISRDYRYELYRGNMGLQLKLGYKFRFYMCKNYLCGLPIFFFATSIVGIVWFFQIDQLIVWQYTASISFLLLATIFDIVASISYPFAYWMSKAIRYCKRKRSQKLYKVGLFGQESVSCAICLMDYCKGEIIYILPCSNLHHFHKQCLSHWAQVENVCPFCRKQFDFID